MKKLAVAFFILGCMASANASERLEYIVTKDGEPIGYERVEIKSSGNQLHVSVNTQTDVKILFLKFHYKHQRTEVWEDEKLVSVSSKTNDDGDMHHYELYRQGQSFILAYGGKDQEIDGQALPLSLWSKAVLDHSVLLSVVDAQPYKVTTTSLGENHYQLDGDIKRELWFADDGYLQKLVFEHKGYQIQFLRK